MIRVFLFLLALWMAGVAQAQIVDTWTFASAQQQETSLSIARQLRCPQCQNQNLLESNAPVAVSMRHQVFTMVAEGKSEAEITRWMTQRYGDFVLYSPPLKPQTWILWGLPVLLILLLGGIFRKAARALPGTVGDTLAHELQQDLRGSQATQATHSPVPVRLLRAAAVLVMLACLTVYGLSSRPAAVMAEQQRLADPLRAFATEREPEKQLIALQDKIRATPQDSALWATLGEYYLYRNAFDNALLAYQRALALRGENAELYAAMATVLYYQAGQNITPETRKMIDHALALDAGEVTALMLLASDAFMTADYKQAIALWQQLLDANSPRIDRAKLIEAINLATMLKNQQQ